MKFDYIKIKEGMYERYIEFDEHNNLIFSEENSQGKTTLLRLMVYSLGYRIPDTKSIKFANCLVESKVHIVDNYFILIRQGDFFQVVNQQGEKSEFVLQDEQDELHKILFGLDNLDILHNLL